MKNVAAVSGIGKKSSSLFAEELPLPDELKIEHYDRRIQKAVFDRIDLTLNFRPGKGGVGCVLKSFQDAIRAHDEIVKVVEEKMDALIAIKRFFRKKNRLFRNLDSAWNVMLEDNVNDFYEYMELLPRMKNAEKRMQQISDAQAKAKLLTEYKRFRELDPVCSNQLIIYNTYLKAREERDEALKNYVESERELNRLRENEKKKAALISDDHVTADELKKSLGALFPNIHVGYILSKVNRESVEALPFDQVQSVIRRAKRPHEVEFRRYDYRFDPFLQDWLSLQELRDAGVCVEDPMLQRAGFCSFASRGDVATIKQLLRQGEDPDSTDYSGSSALLLAAANKHAEVVQLLYEAGAEVDFRDKNMMTPLLYSAQRGYIEIVRQLIDLGADRDSRDKNKRGVLYYAVLSGVVPLLKLFVRPETCNEPEEVWGFTPLHLAVSTGDQDLVTFLVQFGSSIYQRDKSGRTAEDLAREYGYKQIAELLESERLSAPGQLAFVSVNGEPVNIFETEGLGANSSSGGNSSSGDAAMGGSKSGKNKSIAAPELSSAAALLAKLALGGAGDARIFIYLGDESALEENWCMDVGINEVIYIQNLDPEEEAARKREQEEKESRRRTRMREKRAEGGGVAGSYSHSASSNQEEDGEEREEEEGTAGCSDSWRNSHASYSSASYNTDDMDTETRRGTERETGRGTGDEGEGDGEEGEREVDLPPHALWLQYDNEVGFCGETICGVEDDDTSPASWQALNKKLPRVLKHGLSLFQRVRELAERAAAEAGSGAGGDWEDFSLTSSQSGFSSGFLRRNRKKHGAGVVPSANTNTRAGAEAGAGARELVSRESMVDDAGSHTGSIASASASPEDVTLRLLICDDSGDSTSPAVLTALLLLKHQMRIRDAISQCQSARPSVRMSVSMRRGLENMQRALDEKQIQRLNRKLRSTNVISSGF